MMDDLWYLWLDLEHVTLSSGCKSKPVQLRFLGTGPLTCAIGNQAPKISIADETVGFRNVEKGFYT